VGGRTVEMDENMSMYHKKQARAGIATHLKGGKKQHSVEQIGEINLTVRYRICTGKL
jgi:hypothetical protein